MAIRSFELAKVALQAEQLRWRRMVQARVRRVTWFGITGVFALLLLMMIHLLGFLALAQYAHFSPFMAALAVTGVDLIAVLICYAIAASSTADAMAEEAREVREQALIQLRNSLAVATLLRQVGRVAIPLVSQRLLGRKRAR
jgi:nitrate reductase gamma subunit